MDWREQQQTILESYGTKDYRIPHLRFDAHACCFIDEESGKAWDPSKHPRDESGRWSAITSHLKESHPFPQGQLPNVPGMLSRVDRTPEQDAALEAHDKRTAAWHRANAARLIHQMLNGKPQRLTPLPPPDATLGTRMRRLQRAIEDVDTASAEETFLGDAFAHHTAEVVSSHEGGAAAWEAAKVEAQRRYEDAVKNAYEHLAEIPAGPKRDKADRILARHLRQDSTGNKAWEANKHPRGGDSKNPGRFSSGAGGGTVDEPTKRPEPSAIPPTRATGGSVRPPQESQTPKAPQPSSTADRSPLHHAMEKAPLKHADVLKGGANATSLLTLEDGTKAVFKTPDGEDPEAGREGVPLGTQYRREIAASRVADVLGFGDLVPATTVRDQGGDVGSVQAFVDYAYNPSQFDNPFDGPKGAARAAVFDYLVGHLDRHQGNWLLKGGKLFLIDNGLSFPDAYHTDDFFNMEFWKYTQQEDLPMPDVSALAGKWDAVEKELRDSGIEDAAIGLAKQRYDAVVDGGKEYVSELPSLLGEEGGPTLGDMAQYYSRGARKDRHNAMVAEKERVFLEERKRAREARRAAAERGD